MKKIFLLVFVVGVCHLAQAKLRKIEHADYTEYLVDIEGVDVVNLKEAGRSFQKLKLKGVEGHQGIHYQVGAPELPVLRFLLIGDIEISDSQWARSQARRAKLSSPLYPAQASRVKLKGAQHEFSYDQAVYSQRSFYPHRQYTIQEAGSLQGQPQKLLTIFPLRYNPTSGEYIWQQKFSFKVYRTADRAQRGTKEFFAFVVGQKFAGSVALEAYKKSKTQLGYTVKEFIVEQQQPAAIRAWLQNLYRDPSGTLKYALIIGDNEDVPGKESDLILGVTDHYYRAIDTEDYQSDINGPDIGLGRISISDEQQLTAVLSKYTRYQRGDFAADKWLKQVSFLATDDKWEIAEATHNYVIENYTKSRQYKGIFPEADMLGGDQLYAITHDVPDSVVHQSMNEGRSIINYSGHGAVTFWDAPRVKPADVLKMNSDSALPFVISNACITGQFTAPESFGETWQRHPYGASFFWGSMDNTFWDEDDVLEKRMYDGIYQHGYLRFAEITQHALSEHWKHYGGQGKSAYYWETYVSFGDPSLQLRHDNLRHIQDESLSEIPLGQQHLDIFLRDQQGQVIVGARAALVSADAQHAVVSHSDDKGLLRFDVEELAQSSLDKEFKLSVEAVNTRSFQKTIRFFDPVNAFVRFEDLKINGRDQLTVSPGESLDLSLRLKNIGKRPSAVGSLRVELTGDNHLNASVVKTVPVLHAQENFEIENWGMNLSLDKDLQAGDRLSVKLMWTDDNQQKSELSKIIVVERAALQIDSLSLRTLEGEVGIPLEGEAVAKIAIRNTGTEPIRDLQLSAASGSCLASALGELSLAQLAPGEQHCFHVPLSIVSDGSCNLEDKGQLQVRGAYQSRQARLDLAATKDFTLGVLTEDHFQEEHIDMAIPDATPEGVEFAFVLSEEQALLANMLIDLQIDHSYVGDLRVQLVAPSGDVVTLHDREGGDSNDIVASYSFANLKQLAKLEGQNLAGQWALRIADNTYSDHGQLRSLSIKTKAFRAE